MKVHAVLVACVLILVGCASGAPKKVYDGPVLPPSELATVHPIAVPGGLMLITDVDDRSTYAASIGYFGSIYIRPGEHSFKVEVSHGFKVQDAGGPAWTTPQGVTFSPLVGSDKATLLVPKGSASVLGRVEAGKVYEIRFGFDRTRPETPIPGIWLSEVPSGA